MSKLRNLRNRPFLIVKTIQRVAKDQNGRNVVDTAIKGWGDNPNHWSLFENRTIADRVSDKNMREATVIIDIMRGECVTHRFPSVTDDEVVQHFLEKYQEDCRQAIDVWLTKVATKMAQDPNFARAQDELASAPPDATEEASAESSEG